jgi:hypothetical protein
MSGTDFNPTTGTYTSTFSESGPFNGLDSSVISYNVSSFAVDVTPIISFD